MKARYIFFIVFVSTSIVISQTITIGTGSSLYVPSGTDMCAGDYGNIFGNIYGEGTQCGDTPVPVELSSFTALVNNNTTVQLKWKTETEVDNYGFDIERCVENQIWEKIGFVEGHGNSNSPKYYSFTDKKPIGGSKYKYRLKQIDTNGDFKYSDIVEVEMVPTKFVLYQNYPNPFNSSTVIRYSLPQSSRVEILVFNAIGEVIKKEVFENQEIGYYEFKFLGNHLTSGTYLYKLQAGNFVETKKMVLMK